MGSMGYDAAAFRTREHGTSTWQVRLSLALAGWGLLYASYRGYYAAGRTIGMHGTPASMSDFRMVNLAGAIILGVWALFPIAALPLWQRPRARNALFAVSWLGAVFLCMHALVEMTIRVLSLAGFLQSDYPHDFWLSYDRRKADLQDLFGNEPWFLLDGLAVGALAWISSDSEGRRRRWTLAGIGATMLLWVYGLLAATHVVGKVILF